MTWLPKQCVVVPIDFSDDSFEALATARQLVERPEDLRLVHVLPRLEATEPGVVWETVSDASRRRHAEAALRERLAGSDCEGANVTIPIGDPGREIAQTAEDAEADLIVLPSHGRTGISRLLIGSVAERVVRLAHCPVLVLRK
jgi:nucleotide-binding universal stress UspA family protein